MLKREAGAAKGEAGGGEGLHVDKMINLSERLNITMEERSQHILFSLRARAGAGGLAPVRRLTHPTSIGNDHAPIRSAFARLALCAFQS